METLDNIYQLPSTNDHDESSYLPKNDFLFKKTSKHTLLWYCYNIPPKEDFENP